MSIEIKRSDGKYGWHDLSTQIKLVQQALARREPKRVISAHANNALNVYRGLSHRLANRELKPKNWPVLSDPSVIDRHLLGTPLANLSNNIWWIDHPAGVNLASKAKTSADHVRQLSTALDLIFSGKYRKIGKTNLLTTANNLKAYHDQIFGDTVKTIIDVKPVKIGIHTPLLHWALTELIGNAKKAIDLRPRGYSGVIKISNTEDKSNHIVEITDNGIGMTPTQLNEAFGGVSGFRAQGTEGSGKVLPKIKEVIEAQGAKLKVQSTHGVGTTFSIIIPKNKNERRKTHAK